MPAETYKHDGTDWQLITAIQYTDSIPTDRDLTEMWYNDAGTWQQVYDSIGVNTVSLTDTNIGSTRNTSGSSGTVTAGYKLTTDGYAQRIKNLNSGNDTIATTDLPNDDWWTGKPETGIGDLYEVRATEVSFSGSGTKTGALATWTPLTSDQSWDVVDSGINLNRSTTWELTIEIGLVGTSTALFSSTVTITGLLFS